MVTGEQHEYRITRLGWFTAALALGIIAWAVAVGAVWLIRDCAATGDEPRIIVYGPERTGGQQ